MLRLFPVMHVPATPDTPMSAIFRSLTLLNVLVPLAASLVLLLVWLPEIEHYYVPGGYIDDQVIERSRREPGEHVLARLGTMAFITTPAWSNEVQALAMAERLLREGRLQLQGFPDMGVTLPFRDTELEQGLPGWQLHLASLQVPEILLAAYQASGEEKYFEAATQAVLAWARYERRAWLPQGFLWNDHAVAARVPVLARFWHTYRRHKSFDSHSAKLILGMGLRAGQMLAKPSHFTFATNHGVMQSLALWHLALAFPELPETRAMAQLAETRLAGQMGFYVNDEGVVLEHSAGYHAEGTRLLGMAICYLTWLNRPVPNAWVAKYDRALRFHAQLRRPDGSLPMFGDTGSGVMVAQPIPVDACLSRHATRDSKGQHPTPVFALYPTAGYAVLWTGGNGALLGPSLSQTVATWSFFPGHGHKLADELSVLHWARGQTWWSNVGYWPYGVSGRDEADGWGGSNAPHAIGEFTGTKRESRLRYYGSNGVLSVIELERSTADGYRVRRQVYDLAERVTLVLDNAYDTGHRRTRVVWRTFPDVQVSRRSNGAYRLSTQDGASLLDAFFLGSAAVGLKSPPHHEPGIDGWLVLGSVPTPTTVWMTEFPSDGSWSALAWSAGMHRQQPWLVATPDMTDWRDPEHWELRLSGSDRTLRVVRNGAKVQVWDGRLLAELTLSSGDDVSAGRARIRQSYLSMNELFGPTYRDVYPYRIKISLLWVALFSIQEGLYLVLRRRGSGLRVAYRLAALVGWIAAGTWLQLVYFAVG